MNRFLRTRWPALLALALLLVTSGCSSGMLRNARESVRDTGSEAGKIIAVVPVPGAMSANVLVYSSLFEARVTCLNLDDFDRVAEDLSLGDSIAVLGGGSTSDSGGDCMNVRRWWRVGKSPKADAVVGIRHDIAMRFFGIPYPEAMKQFLGTGPTHLHVHEIERLANHSPQAIRAFRIWGIDTSKILEQIYDDDG